MSIRRGGCLCGDIAFVAKGEPRDVTHCYCSMCRRSSGGGSQTFAQLRSTDVTWTKQPRAFRSSPDTRRGFCERCGSSLYLDYDAQPGWIWLTAGTFDDPESLTPTLHWCVDDKLSWVAIDPDLPGEP